MVTIDQIKAARALLGWSQADLAKAAGYALPTINNLERGETNPRTSTLQDVRQAVEQAGVQLYGHNRCPAGEGGAGHPDAG